MQDLDQLDRTQAVADLLKDSFSRFIQHFWKHVDPAPYEHGWHIDLMAEYLEAMARGRDPQAANQHPSRLSEVAHGVSFLARLGLDTQPRKALHGYRVRGNFSA